MKMRKILAAALSVCMMFSIAAFDTSREKTDNEMQQVYAAISTQIELKIIKNPKSIYNGYTDMWFNVSVPYASNIDLHTTISGPYVGPYMLPSNSVNNGNLMQVTGYRFSNPIGNYMPTTGTVTVRLLNTGAGVIEMATFNYEFEGGFIDNISQEATISLVSVWP